MSERSLEGRVVFITGGASGIGRASAQRFASEGADVVLADLDRASGEGAARAIAEASGQQALYVQCDVTDEDSQRQAFAQTIEAFGKVDGVLAAAGVSSANYVSGRVSSPNADPEAGHLVNKPLADWQKVLDVNLSGVMLTGRTAARLMIDGDIKGSIVNIASVAGRIGLIGAGDYCVSKAGVVMLTQVLARELVGYGIRVNAIGPGFIETPMTAGIRQTPEGNQRAMGMTPMQRFGTPEEIANTAQFLMSDQSSYFTGQTLFPSGGMFVG
jgi:NAD(P)-dependent dehydrogenase (short-subunit alcohol dehydrogenase family)